MYTLSLYGVHSMTIYVHRVSLYIYVHSITIQCTHVQCPYTVWLYSVCNVTIKFTIPCTQGHYKVYTESLYTNMHTYMWLM